MYVKHQLSVFDTKKQLRDFKDLYSKCMQPKPQQSSLYYMEVIDKNPDSTDTMHYVSQLLLQTLRPNEHVVLIGDGKTYEHLMKVKRIYGSALSSLHIFPGDWHTLKNFQPVLMKIYYHAGLKEVAQASGYKGETLTSLENCTNFKRTNQFFLQVWQAMYLSMISAFLTNTHDLPTVTLHYNNDLSVEESMLEDSKMQERFVSFALTMASRDNTWKFWYQFVFEDCFCYIELFLAIRWQNWDLRLSALKSMATLFAAYDRTTYRRLIPNHLADLQRFPPDIVSSLKEGFTLSINGTVGHNVAIDEAHEMCINKDLKMAITYPTRSYLQKTSLFLRYRITAHKNLLEQLLPSTCKESKEVNGITGRTFKFPTQHWSRKCAWDIAYSVIHISCNVSMIYHT